MSFLAALACALCLAGGFAYGFIVGCRVGDLPTDGGYVPDKPKPEDRPE